MPPFLLFEGKKVAQSFGVWHRALVCDTELWGVTQSFWDVAQSFGCGTELRFGSLCNLGLSKKLRFSLQRHKT